MKNKTACTHGFKHNTCFFIQALPRLLSEFLGTVWTYCRGDNSHYIIISPASYTTILCYILTPIFSVSCTIVVGMEDGEIEDNQITASHPGRKRHGIPKARISSGRCWSPPQSHQNPWIQVSLHEEYLLSGLTIQGCLEDEIISFYVMVNDIDGHLRYINDSSIDRQSSDKKVRQEVQLD